MSEHSPILPIDEGVRVVEHTVSLYIDTVHEGMAAAYIPDDEIQQVTVEDIRGRQTKHFDTLLGVARVIDWAGIVYEERSAHQELEAAVQLADEAEAEAEAKVLRIDESVDRAVRLAPDIQEKLVEIAERRRKVILEEGYLPAVELRTEREEQFAHASSTFLRAGRAWPIPNLIEIPVTVEQAESTADTAENTAGPVIIESGAEALSSMATMLGLSSREKQMLIVMAGSIQEGQGFRQADLDLSSLEFASLGAKGGAFTRFTQKLLDAGVLTSTGVRGGKRYVLVSALLPHEEGHDDTIATEVSLKDGSEVVIELSPAEEEPDKTAAEIDTPQDVEPTEETITEPRIQYVQSLSGNRTSGENKISEGTFAEVIKNHLKIKDPQLAKQVVKWMTWLTENPTNIDATRKVRAFPEGIRVMVGEANQTVNLLRFSPTDAPGLSVPRAYHRRRVVYVIINNQPAILEILDHDDFDRKYK